MYSSPDPIVGHVEWQEKLLPGQSGREVVSVARIYFEADVADIPPESLIELPAEYGGDTRSVLSFSRRSSARNTLSYVKVELR